MRRLPPGSPGRARTGIVPPPRPPAVLIQRMLDAQISGVAFSADPVSGNGEVAVLAERADVSEELARLRSHVDQFDRLIREAGEIGKKLDFLLQEMQREANTLLSKTPGLGQQGLDMTELGLQIKADIEKLREQVQNVE